eukprot:scaffold1199_cov265-Pinguiococcus_pyrenoidosus.AAC.31
MRLGHELARGLAEVIDLLLRRVLVLRVLDLVDVDTTLVGEIEEDVVGLLGRRTSLLVAKDQIDPLVKIAAHMLTLQRLLVKPDKLPWISLRPRRQHHTVHGVSILKRPEAELVAVQEHLRHAEQLRNELLHVRHGGGAAGVRLVHVEEQPVGAVESTIVEVDGHGRVRLLPDEIVQHHAGAGVVGAVHEGRHLRIRNKLEALISVEEGLQPIGTEGANRFLQVSESGWVAQVQRVTGIVRDHPREDGILSQIVVASTGNDVEPHDVLKVADLPLTGGTTATDRCRSAFGASGRSASVPAGLQRQRKRPARRRRTAPGHMVSARSDARGPR